MGEFNYELKYFQMMFGLMESLEVSVWQKGGRLDLVKAAALFVLWDLESNWTRDP